MIEHEKALYSISRKSTCECGGAILAYTFTFTEWDYTKCDKCGKKEMNPYVKK